MIVSPSVLSCDFGNIERDVKMLHSSDAQWIHIDVMDGVFVPNISFGFPVLEVIRKHTDKVLDVHLMIENPDNYLVNFKNSGSDILTVHIEACRHLNRTISAIKELGMKAGVALNPHTPVSALEEVIKDLDLALIMSVNPGFGGQKFIHSSIDKVKKLAQLIQEKKSNAIIEVDGGVNLETGLELKKAGAQALVAGSFVFGSANPVETITRLNNL
ncbi:MAG: ribulose-phosphate 3-epimerase [Bacteroidetes bacterium]|nr:ribulose-phosphate 3-epimerase [Bacteroidota bacterium]